MNITQKHVDKIHSLLDHGLVKGLGSPNPGKMCVEAVICYALGLPHSDNPQCVDPDVRQYKIGLNDKNWSSTKARAEGLRELAIAQLGSDILKPGEFKKALFLQAHKDIVIPSFDRMKKEYRVLEHEELKQFCIDCSNIEELKKKFRYHYYYYYYYYHYYYHYNYYYYNYNHNYHYYYHNYHHHFLYDYTPDEILILSAKVAVKVLKQLNSPGCRFLSAAS